jgi:type IV pilus assembly protein PilY1
MSTFPTKVPALALNIASSPCVSESTMTADTCRDRYVKWLVGAVNGSTEKYNRCTTPGSTTCSLVADVYHSVPALVNRPSENLRDESYQRFALAEQRTRPLVLYTSTNDGFLHAFKVASNDPTETTSDAKVETRTNNELWAFLPPAVLPRVPDEYPNVHQPLLDGAPVTRDVAGYKDTSTGAIKFERNLSTIGASESLWRTVLVQSFGGSYPGYFALDITDPVGGPKFLWQLTTDGTGKPLFGDYGATPTITTLYFDPDASGTPREVSVALLPGGNGGAAPDTTKQCDRADLSVAGFPDSTTKPRTKVPCYDRDAARRGRSLTVVRLDTGEIIRTFRRSTADAPTSITSLVTLSPLDSPITGQPVAYPGWTGAIADRAYVGDRDGSLWRADLTSTDPTKWTMKLFFDAYRNKTAQAGQPIANAPVLSTNDLGEVVVVFATGNQDDLVSTTSTETFIYSLREHAADALTTTVSPLINWYYRFTSGERVTGPLTLFSNGIYFSTYAPPTSDNDACSSGTSRVGGMHYLNLDSTNTQSVDGDALSRGGVAMLPRNGDSTSLDRVQFYDQTNALFAQGSVIFGVGIAQVPSCFQTGTVSTDPFFGTSYQSTTTTSAASYQLVMQTGNQGTATSGGVTKTVSVNLPAPDTSPRIDSWALVME